MDKNKILKNLLKAALLLFLLFTIAFLLIKSNELVQGFRDGLRLN